MKAISSVIAAILLLMITIALASTAYMFTSGMLTGKIAKTIDILSFSGNLLVVQNMGTQAIASGDLKVLVNGQEVEVINSPFPINPQSSATVKFLPPQFGQKLSAATVQVVSPSNAVTFQTDIVPHAFRTAENMLGLWHLDEIIIEGSNKIVEDSSDNNYDGTLATIGSSIPISTLGKFSNALSFDGSSSYVSIPKDLDNSIPAGSPLTVMAWIKPAAYGNPASSVPGRVIFGETGTGFQTRYGIYIDSNGRIKYGWCNGCYILGNRQIPIDSEWHFVAVVHNGNNVKIFVDGDLDLDYNGASPIGSIVLSYQEPVAIGIWLDWWERPNSVFSGSIDEVIVLDEPLSQEQIVDSIYG